MDVRQRGFAQMQAASDPVSRAAQLVLRAQAIVLDFDGTLVDSNHIKLEGFLAAFDDVPERHGEILAYCKKTSAHRALKIRQIHRHILHSPCAAALLRDRLDKYAVATTEPVVHAREIPGARAFLRWLKGKKPLALLSATDATALALILRKRRMAHFFDRIAGAPVEKDRWLVEHAALLGVRRSALLLFGDSDEDEDAARSARTRFVRVCGAGAESISEFRTLLTRL